MKYLPYLVIGLVVLLCLSLSFCGGSNKNFQPQQSVVETSQQQPQQTYQPQYAETMEGSRGTFYVKDVEDEMYKKGFRLGFDGKQGWAVQNWFDDYYQDVIGKPENKKQKDDYKKYRDQMYKAYHKGWEEGFEPNL